MRELRLRVENTAGFSQFKSDSRGKDFQALAQIVYLIEHGAGRTATNPSSANIEKFLAKGCVHTGPLQVKVNLAMDCFIRIVQDPDLARPLLERELVALEFVMAVYLVHLYRATLSEAQLSEAIRHMRMHWNSRKPEGKKLNTDAFKYLSTFVHKQVPKLKLVDRVDMLMSDDAAFLTPKPPEKSQRKAVSTAASKRTATVPAKRKVDELEEEDDDCNMIPIPARKKSASMQKQETVTPVPVPAIQTEKPLPLPPKAAPSTLKAKLESRASTSRAKTTVKKASPAKRKSTNYTAVPTPSAFSAKPVLEQVATPSVKTPQRTTLNVPSSAQGDPKRLARASSITSTASTSISWPAVTARPHVPSGSNRVSVAFSGMTTPSASPCIPIAVPQYALERLSSTNVMVNVDPSAPKDRLPRLAPIRAAKEAAEKKRSSMTASASSTTLHDLAGNTDVTAHPASTVSTAPQASLKNVKFNKTNSSTAVSVPVAFMVNAMNEEDPWNFGAPVRAGSGTVNRGPAISKPAVTAPTAEIRKPVPRSPSTDPRLRPGVQRTALGTSECASRLPTPPQSGLSSHISSQQLLPGPTQTHEQILSTARQKRHHEVSEDAAARQPLQQTKHSRPSAQPSIWGT